MTILPDFSEDTEKSILLYFLCDGQNEKDLCDELQKTYMCYEKMSTVVKDSKKYVVLQIADAENEK